MAFLSFGRPRLSPEDGARTPKSSSAKVGIERRCDLARLAKSRNLMPPHPGLDDSNDCLPASMDVDVLHGDFLLALASVLVQSLHVQGIGSGELISEVEILLPGLETLIRKHRSPKAFHRCVMNGNHLSGEHAFDFVARADASQRLSAGSYHPLFFLFIVIAQPEGVNRLSRNN
jgi:hypothetical protein